MQIFVSFLQQFRWTRVNKVTGHKWFNLTLCSVCANLCSAANCLCCFIARNFLNPPVENSHGKTLASF